MEHKIQKILGIVLVSISLSVFATACDGKLEYKYLEE